MSATAKRRKRKRIKKDPRPQISSADRDRLLGELEEVAAARRGTIEDARELRQEEDDRHREVLAAIDAGQHAANDSLVRLFDLAYDRGVTKQSMLERIGMSHQRMYSLRADVERRRKEREKGD